MGISCTALSWPTQLIILMLILNQTQKPEYVVYDLLQEEQAITEQNRTEEYLYSRDSLQYK